MKVYFKGAQHEQNTKALLKSLNLSSLYEVRTLGAFCYLVGGVNPGLKVLNIISKEDYTFEITDFLSLIKTFSYNEQLICRFALQRVKNNLENITLDEIMQPLDKSNREMLIQAVRIQYE